MTNTNLEMELFHEYKTLAKKLFSGEYTIRKYIYQIAGGNETEILKKKINYMRMKYLTEYDKFMKKLPKNPHIILFYHLHFMTGLMIFMVSLDLDKMYQNIEDGKDSGIDEINPKIREKFGKKLPILSNEVIKQVKIDSTSKKFINFINKKYQELLKINQDIKKYISKKKKNKDASKFYQGWYKYLIELIDYNLKSGKELLNDKKKIFSYQT